jgi:ABC-type amino acid transport substrate-binding protein
MFRTISLVIAALIISAAARAEGPDGRLKKIADSKTINIAYRTDAAPFSFVDDKGQMAGFSVELCKRIVGSIEHELGMPDLNVNWMPVTVQTRFFAIIEGKADMECGASTVTLGRMKAVDFSSFIFVETTGLLTTKGSGLRSFSGIAGKKIAVIANTTNERAIRDQLKQHHIDATVIRFKSSDEAMPALESGEVDAIASDRRLLMSAASRAKDPKKLVLLADELSFEPYGITLPRNESALRHSVDTALSQLYRSKEFDGIFKRWFKGYGAPSPILRAVYILGAIPD